MADDEISPLNDWHQGDLALVPLELPCLIMEDGEPVVAFMQAPYGVAVLTQSCEIIRCATDRPDVHVAVLVKVEAEEAARIHRGDRPSNAIVPGIAPHELAIDLDSIATVSKEIVATWPRTQGCPDDASKQDLARRLARHRQRFAFPDAFNNEVARHLRRWVQAKRKSNGEHGQFIRETDEFRVHCDNWGDPTEIMLLAILKRAAVGEEVASWQASLDAMIGKVRSEHYPVLATRIVTWDDISAREYLESDRLDWDALSDV